MAISVSFSAVVPLPGAEDFTRDVQGELKRRGFFYAEISGILTPETVTALRRFQIRYGLEVTGAVTPETLEALGVGVSDTRRNTRRRAPQSISPEPARVAEGPQAGAPSNAVPESVAPGRDLEKRQVVAFYERLLEGTPCSGAALEVQQRVVLGAQQILQRSNLLGVPVSGIQVPEFIAALIRYQNQAGLRLTGRLDIATLDRMQLLDRRNLQVPPLYQAAPLGIQRREYKNRGPKK
jgi:peptidoglycan hydrolase-like protein with peptidoglycan-binding domain